MHPQQGGSYRRETDQSLTRVAFTADATGRPDDLGKVEPAAEPAADLPATNETASDTDGASKKGKA
ncbi:hypothetical protein [Rhizobium lusitanum]|uniref:Uncharacterized protein n=1 Tax=Rhizobium lusitanum TaxID=293958 RepID=A0A1C3USS3_9HYPH|nr:hypothetical protein [Rhizobium lusitanum]SCB18505.1 hypothetical protein GA0061101_103271 [Rhizobium lusitanum]